MDGAWERLVRSVKVALRATLNEHAPSEEVLRTLLEEIEYCINSRPLTHVSVDPRDEAKKVCVKSIAFSADICRRVLASLVTRITAYADTTAKMVRQAGDSSAIILIADFLAPRNTWRKGKIVQVYTEADGIIRVAKVQTQQGDVVRAIHKLIPLFKEESTKSD